MSEEKIIVPFKEAKKRLPSGPIVHTFRQSGFMMLGADWAKKDLLSVMKKHEISETGPHAQATNHGLAITDKSGYLFIATKPKEEKVQCPACDRWLSIKATSCACEKEEADEPQ